MIKFQCMHCKRRLNVKDEYAGRMVKCPNCQQAVTVIGSSDLSMVPEAPPTPLPVRTVARPPQIRMEQVAALEQMQAVPLQYSQQQHAPPPTVIYMQSNQEHNGVVTTQRTAKVWKLQILLSSMTAILGGVLVTVGFQFGAVPISGVGLLTFMFGVGWFLFSRICAWWYHG